MAESASTERCQAAQTADTKVTGDEGGAAPQPPAYVVCRYCASPMVRGAKFGDGLRQFQRVRDRVLHGIDLSSLVALVPVATLAFTFLRTHVTSAESDVKAGPAVPDAARDPHGAGDA
jgi:hypothetical protein